MASFEQYLRAAYPVVWVNTLEPERAEQEMARVAGQVHPGSQTLHWDLLTGLVPVGQGEGQRCGETEVAARVAQAGPGAVAFLWNFHRLTGNLAVLQSVQNSLPALKSQGSCLVVLALDQEKLPPELARLVVTLDYPLPDREALRGIVQQVARDADVVVAPELEEALAEAALGLTVAEAEDSLALSFIETRSLDPNVVAREKAGALLRQVRLQWERYPDRFSDLGGLDQLKEFCLGTAPSPLSLGIILLGVPGAGKSTFAKALGNELGRPTLSLDFGRLLGSLVGQSEAAVREALKAVDAMGRVVLFIDELDKALAGVQGSGELDSGVKAGVGGTFLKWLSDRQPGRAYVVATMNKVNVPPEYLRSERWDALFYVDLPNEEEKTAIWSIWLNKFQVGGPLPPDPEWTGAEIRSCCRIATMMGSDLLAASQYVVPVARSMAEAIQEMRAWAKGRCLSASRPSVAAADGRRRLK